MVKMENPMDRRALHRLEKLGGVELMVRVIDQFLEKVPKRMDAACDGGKTGDLVRLGTAVESIKVAARNVGATEVWDMAGRIERLAVEGAKDLVLPLLCHLDDMLGHAETWLQREKSTLRARKGAAWH